MHSTLERLRTEGWQYLELSGRYSGHHGHVAFPTHLNQFVFFVNTVEKIQQSQIEDQYNGNKEAEKPSVSTSGQPSTGGVQQKLTIADQAVPSPLDLTQNRTPLKK